MNSSALIQLIVNSDDYGRTPAVSAGIRSAHLNGLVTSTTAMMNMAAVDSDLKLARQECPRLGLGVHLVLTAGKPILPPNRVSSLVDARGNFPSASGFLEKLADLELDQVRCEWEEQVEKFVRIVGKPPDHLDSHHHTSYLSPGLLRMMLEVAEELGCGIRPPLAEGNRILPLDLSADLACLSVGEIPVLLDEFHPRCPDDFISSFYDKSATLDHLMAVLDKLSAGTTEIMCHAGFVDAELLAGSSYNFQRQVEHDILIDPLPLAFLQEREIKLVTYSAVFSY